MASSAAGVASMTSWLDAPWMWTSKKDGAMVALGKSRALGLAGISLVARVEMERMWPSSTVRMGWSRRRAPSQSFAAVKTEGM